MVGFDYMVHQLGHGHICRRDFVGFWFGIQGFKLRENRGWIEALVSAGVFERSFAATAIVQSVTLEYPRALSVLLLSAYY